MINTEMRIYDYYTIGKENEYGQQTLPDKNAIPVGNVKMAIYITSQNIQDNINYKGAQYVGLTYANVDDTFIIQYGNERLKVLYVNSQGRYNQVFLAKI